MLSSLKKNLDIFLFQIDFLGPPQGLPLPLVDQWREEKDG